jgi:hypothetical protein
LTRRRVQAVPHIKLCDLAHKSVLRICPLRRTFLKRVTVLNPVKEPERIEKEKEKSEREEREEAGAESVATYETSGSTE